MPLGPKWQRNRPLCANAFVGRTRELGILDDALYEQQMPDTYRVVSVFGVGGQGKTSLIETFQKELREITPPAPPFAVVDFASPENRDQRISLLRIRNQLATFGFSSGVFDIAFARLFALTRHRRVMKEDFPELFGSHLGLFGDFAEIGLTLGKELPGGKLIFEMLSKLPERYKEWYWRNQPVLKELDELGQQELADRLPSFLGYDIAAFVEKDPPSRPVIIFDTYEALWHERAGIQIGPGDSSADEWVRHFVEECPGVLFIIAGRRKLNWERVDSDWSNSIINCSVDDLSEDDQSIFLTKRGVQEPSLRLLMAQNARGHALTLTLQAYYYDKIRAAGRVPQVQDFPPTHKEILDRFVSHLEPSFAALLRIVALTEELGPALWKFLSTRLLVFGIYSVVAVADDVIFKRGEAGGLVIHDVLREHLLTDFETTDPESAKYCRSLIFTFFDEASGPEQNVDQRDRFLIEAAHQLRHFDQGRFPEWCSGKLLSYRMGDSASRIRRRLLEEVNSALCTTPATSVHLRANLARLELSGNPFSVTGQRLARLLLDSLSGPPDDELLRTLVSLAVYLGVASCKEVLRSIHSFIKIHMEHKSKEELFARLRISNYAKDTVESSRLLRLLLDDCADEKVLWSWDVLAAICCEESEKHFLYYLSKLSGTEHESRLSNLPHVLDVLLSFRQTRRLQDFQEIVYGVTPAAALLEAFKGTGPADASTEYVLWMLTDCLIEAGQVQEALALISGQVPLRKLHDFPDVCRDESVTTEILSLSLNDHTGLHFGFFTWGQILRCYLAATASAGEGALPLQTRAMLEASSRRLLASSAVTSVNVGETVMQSGVQAHPAAFKLVVNDRGEAFVFTNDPMLCWRGGDFIAVADRKLFLHDARFGLMSLGFELDPIWRKYFVPGFWMMMVYIDPRTGKPTTGAYLAAYDWDDAVIGEITPSLLA